MIGLVRPLWASASSGAAFAVQGMPYSKPDAGTVWCRARVLHTGGGQKGYSDTKKRYVRHGLLILDVFTPLRKTDNSSDALAASDALAEALVTGIEGQSPGGVTLTQARFEDAEEDAEPGWALTQVIAEFQYDSVH